ncbi:hypothetical protein KAR91_53395 [Candidatus Pacearchaeota archaeon]|nr:hypothetical protein [Candidatus Pacearchaeota archaeon]
MQDRQTSKPVKGINAQGEKREYKFQLMDAETGTRIFHQYAGTMVKVHDTFVDFIVQLSKTVGAESNAKTKAAYNLLGTDENIMFVIKRMPEIFTWEVMAGLAGDMLCNHTVTIDGKEHAADEKGFSIAGDPLEMYTALLYAIEANYPTYIAPLKARLVAMFSDDLTQDSEQDSAKSETPKS